MDTKNIDFSKIHLFKSSKSLLNAVNLTELKKLIKENIKPPKTNIIVYVVRFSLTGKDKPFKIIVGQCTLTPKLNLIIDDDDYSQIITFNKDEYSDFHLTTIGKIIKAFKNKKISFAKLSVPISDILN